MMELLKDSLKTALYYAGYYSLRESLAAPREKRLLILMFHNVVADAEQYSRWYKTTTFTCSQMESIISTLKRHYRIITVEDAVAEMNSAGALKEKSAAITFDDAYESTYHLVFPMLKRHGISCTVYVPTDWIDGKWIPWWMSLTAMIDRCPNPSGAAPAVEKILGRAIALPPEPAPDTDRVRRILSEGIEGALMRQADDKRNEILLRLRDVLVGGEAVEAQIFSPMSWAQMKEMSDSGVCFGAHTQSHPNLSFVDEPTAEREFSESRRIIENHLGRKISGCAYPYGYDVAGYQRFIPVIERMGFEYACTSWPGFVDNSTNRYLLGRVGLPLTSSRAIIARTLSLEYLAKTP